MITTTTIIFLFLVTIYSSDARPTNYFSHKTSCNLCIDEDSIVGLPHKYITDDWTCGTMELEASDIDADDELCQLVQEYANDCQCHHLSSSYHHDNDYEFYNFGKRDKNSYEKNNDDIFRTKKDNNDEDFFRNKNTDGSSKYSDDNLATTTTSSAGSKDDDEKNSNNNNPTDNNNNTNPTDDVSKKDDDESLLLFHKFLTILSLLYLFFVSFAVSAQTPAKTLEAAQRNKRRALLSTGSLIQFLVIPPITVIMLQILKNDTNEFTIAMGFTLLIIASSPGGVYSNSCCSIFNADVDLSLAMTFFSTILCLGTLPLNLALYGLILLPKKVYNYGMVFVILGCIAIALISGRIAYWYHKGTKYETAFMKTSRRLAFWSTTGMTVLFVILSFTTTIGPTTKFWDLDDIFFINVVGVIFTNVISRGIAKIKKKVSFVTLSVECCFKNTAVAISMAMILLPDPEIKAQALAVGIVYTLIQTLIQVAYCLFAWKMGWTNAPEDDSLWDILLQSYDNNDKNNNDIDDDDDTTAADDESQSLLLSSSAEHQPPKDDLEFDNKAQHLEGDSIMIFRSMMHNEGFVPSSQWGKNIQNYTSSTIIGNFFRISNFFGKNTDENSSERFSATESTTESNNNNKNNDDDRPQVVRL